MMTIFCNEMKQGETINAYHCKTDYKLSTRVFMFSSKVAKLEKRSEKKKTGW